MLTTLRNSILLLLLLARAASAQILAENFRNIGCTNCRDGDDAYENYLQTHPEVIIVYVHNDAPSPNDPFYLAATADVDARTSLYKVIGDPTLFINGNFVVTGDQSFFAKAKSATEKADQTTTAPISLHTVNNGNGTFTVTADIAGSLPSAPSVKFYAMLVESEVIYDNSGAGYGRVPNDKWDNIFRKMYPDADGTDAFVLSGPQSFSFSIDTTGTGWNAANLKVIAFLQDTKKGTSNSYPMYSIAQSPKGLLGLQSKTTSGVTIGSLSANPITSTTKLPITLSNPSKVSVLVYNQLGQKVTSVFDEYVTEQELVVKFDPKHLTTGVYYLRVIIDDIPVVIEPIVVMVN